MILACSGCVLNTNAPTEQPVIDDGAVRVEPLRLTLDDGVAPVVLEDLAFAIPKPFERGNDRLPFDYAGHRLSLEAGQIGDLAALGGRVGLRVDGDDYVVSVRRHEVSPFEEHGSFAGPNVALEFDFALEGHLVHAMLELDAHFHCPPYPTTPATPETDGPPAITAAAL